MRKVLVALAILSIAGFADTVFLRDGTVLEGRLSGVSTTALLFETDLGRRSIPLEDVTRISLDFSSDPTPRFSRTTWSRALGQVQREFFNCRYIRHGLVLAGLSLIGFGQWLDILGYNVFGNMLKALGGISILFGLSMPESGCEIPAARLRTLLYIGLEHNWLY